MNSPIVAELQHISKSHGGMLKAEHVVNFAKKKTTHLHAQFEWDNGEAARQYRLFQARQVIRTSVIVMRETGKKIHAFVSLEDDRAQKGGGYRPIVDVLSDQDLRDRLLRQAMVELKSLERKYKDLEELSEVFEAVRKVS